MFTGNAEEAARFNTISVQEHQCYLADHRNISVLQGFTEERLLWAPSLACCYKDLLGGFCSYFISIKKPMQPTGKRFSMKANDESMSGAQWPRTEHGSGRRGCTGQSQLLPYGMPWKFVIAAKKYPSDVISILHLVILHSRACQL